MQVREKDRPRPGACVRGVQKGVFGRRQRAGTNAVSNFALDLAIDLGGDAGSSPTKPNDNLHRRFGI
jgi:hypothetical protein